MGLSLHAQWFENHLKSLNKIVNLKSFQFSRQNQRLNFAILDNTNPNVCENSNDETFFCDF